MNWLVALLVVLGLAAPLIIGYALFVYWFTTFAVKEMEKAGATPEEIENAFRESIASTLAGHEWRMW